MTVKALNEKLTVMMGGKVMSKVSKAETYQEVALEKPKRDRVASRARRKRRMRLRKKRGWR